MRRFTIKPVAIKLGKLEVAAALTPLAMFVVAFTLPAQSDNSDKTPPMTFDSVGSMLQDMDREQSLVSMERHASLPTTGRAAGHACPTDDVNSRMDEVYSRLQTRVEQIDLAEIAQLEAKITMRRADDIEVMRMQQATLIREARTSAASATVGINAAITAMEEQRRVAASKDEKMVAAAVEAALRAAEAALVNQP